MIFFKFFLLNIYIFLKINSNLIKIENLLDFQNSFKHSLNGEKINAQW
jgi:hypothetical protein